MSASRLFSRDGKRWLPSFLLSEPNKIKKHLSEWADEKNFPDQMKISETLAGIENILLKAQDTNASDVTKDLAEVTLLLISSIKMFLDCHNSDNAIRGLIVSFSRVILLIMDPYSLEDTFAELKKAAIIDSKTVYCKDTKNENTSANENTNVNENSKKTEDDKNNDKKTEFKVKLDESMEEIIDFTKKKAEELKAKAKNSKMKNNVVEILSDPAMKELFDEMSNIIKQIADQAFSLKYSRSSYIANPWKNLKKKHGSVYTGLSSMMENALNKPQSWTLKQMAMTTVEAPTDFLVGTGWGVQVGLDAAKKRINEKKEMINETRGSGESKAPHLRRARSLPENAKQLFAAMNSRAGELKERAGGLKERAGEFKERAGELKENASKLISEGLHSPTIAKASHLRDQCISELKSLPTSNLKRSKSYPRKLIARMNNFKHKVVDEQKILEEWIHSNEKDEIERRRSQATARTSCSHSREPSTKQRLSNLRKISKRTKLSESLRREIKTLYDDQSVKTLSLSRGMKESIMGIIEKLDRHGLSITFAIVLHFFKTYSMYSGITKEIETFLEQLKLVLTSLSNKGYVEKLTESLKALHKTTSYETLVSFVSLERERPINMFSDVKEDVGGSAKIADVQEEGSYSKRAAACIIDLIESNEGRAVISNILDIYILVRLDQKVRRCSKAMKMIKLVLAHYKASDPSYVLAYKVLRDLIDDVVPKLIKNSKMISVPIRRAIEVKGFELYFVGDPQILLKEFMPDRIRMFMDHRTTKDEVLENIVDKEVKKHPYVPSSIRNFIKFFLKVTPTSVERFQEWDITEGEFGPKWSAKIVLSGIHVIVHLENVELLATNRYKGSLGNATYKLVDGIKKMSRKKKKHKEKLPKPGADKDPLIHTFNNSDTKFLVMGDKKIYRVWKGKAEGVIYGKGIVVSLIFESTSRKVDSKPAAQKMAKLSGSKSTRNPKSDKFRVLEHQTPENKTSKHGEQRKKKLSEKLFNSTNNERIRFAGVKVDVPYYSTRLKIKGHMGSVISMVAEKKIRQAVKESVENMIVDSLGRLNYKERVAL